MVRTVVAQLGKKRPYRRFASAPSSASVRLLPTGWKDLRLANRMERFTPKTKDISVSVYVIATPFVVCWIGDPRLARTETSCLCKTHGWNNMLKWLPCVLATWKEDM